MNFLDLLKGTAAYLANKAKDAVNWYKEKILKIGKNSSLKETDNIFKKASYPQIGKMYIYYYDPYYKFRLPFWDTYPLVIPIEPVTITRNAQKTGGGPGFLGLNLHYLPPGKRATLLQALTDLRNNDKYDDTTKLNISYEILSKSSNYPGYKECIHRYYLSHIRSSLHEVNFNDWDKVVLLPLQNWKLNSNRKLAKSPPY